MPKSAKLSTEEAKAKALEQFALGATVRDAMKAVGRQPKTHENWRASDLDYKNAVDAARDRSTRAKDAGKDPALYELGFAEWRKRFLGRDTYPHQQMWIDVLEEREPVVFHPAITYRPGNHNYVLINTPPAHAKSSTITMDYATYKLCMNPAYRVIIISKIAEMASKFLHAIRTYFTDPYFIELQEAYGPPTGFKPQRGEGRWGNTEIYLASRNLDAADKAAKDPSVKTVGLGGQVYGLRADLIIVDDAIDDTNHTAFEKQFDWLTRTVMSRTNGKTLVVGTRIAPTDLYSHLLDPDSYMSGEVPWTYLAQPAVLEFAEKPEDWLTLWPKSSTPVDELADEPGPDGLYPAQDGKRLSSIQSRLSASMWALVYQQESVSDDMTFHPTAVWGSVDKRRAPGPLIPGALGHRPHGMEGLRVILSIDPAAAGEAAMMVVGVDRTSKERWVLNAWKKRDTVPSWYLQQIEAICPQYGVSDIVIEAQGYSNWIIHDEGIMAYVRDHGIRLHSTYTGKNKIDPDLGVGSMSSLFGGLERVDEGNRWSHKGDNVIHLPDPKRSPGIKALISELITWIPSKKAKNLTQDCVMCLFFAEQIARVTINGGDRPPTTHLENRFLSRGRRNTRWVRPSGFGYTN